ncbi:molybdopterin molybdenumtransferase MoeA [Pilimelia anulata]|uniref:Molybdopterin molybdenumtransferase n=1 Tax=Pilimelia anulata TaxID=53371 RepID=A0A8J3FBV1_9ACTN|nr:molybdopterin-binding protein [Pilimelia anulata]GGJ87425.1 molybdopterin molybdenumtransferase MoeA [Pilimelia anulata]
MDLPTEPPPDWAAARAAAHAAGAAAPRTARRLPLSAAFGGAVLAGALRARTDLPSFPTSAVDGYAVRGPAPWRLVGRVLAGHEPPPLTADGTTVEVATGAHVPPGTTAVLRYERTHRMSDTVTPHADALSDRLTGCIRGRSGHHERTRSPSPDPVPGDGGAAGDCRPAGEEARAGEVLLAAGTAVTPAVVALAAAAGHDELSVWPAPAVRVLVLGDELLAAGPATGVRLRDALGPALPGWLLALGAAPVPPAEPVPDTVDGHLAALRATLAAADVVCTTGGTMRGPADHLHAALRALGAVPLVAGVAVRPGGPMALYRVDPPGRPPAEQPTHDPADRPRFVAGLPGNPQAAVAALVTLVGPLLAGLRGLPLPPLPTAALAAAVPGRAGRTRLVPVRFDPATGAAVPVPHAGPAMLRGLAVAASYAAVPATGAAAGDRVPTAPLPGA